MYSGNVIVTCFKDVPEWEITQTVEFGNRGELTAYTKSARKCGMALPIMAAMTTRRRVVGERLRAIRTSRGLTLEQLGQLVHKSHSTLGNYEQGIRMPDLDML